MYIEGYIHIIIERYTTIHRVCGERKRRRRRVVVLVKHRGYLFQDHRYINICIHRNIDTYVYI